MKPLKIIYSVFVAFIVLVTLLLIISVLPIERLPGGQAVDFKVMTVISGSMEPAIKMGSVVVVKPSEEYKIGDVITFGPYTKEKTPTTHRINDIRVVEDVAYYITKGDANSSPDQKEVSEKEIIGKVLFSVPYLGYAVDAAKKPMGFMLIIIAPAAIIIGDELRKIWVEIKTQRGKREGKRESEEVRMLKEKISELENKKSEN